MTHRDALDCPCHPEARDALGGGRVLVHGKLGEAEGRESESYRSPDRYCMACNTWHLIGHAHFEVAV